MDTHKVEDVASTAFDAAQKEMAKLMSTGALLRFQLLRAHGDLPSIGACKAGDELVNSDL